MKMRRSERIVAVTKILTDQPYKLISLNYFTERFNAAKSTISEDLSIIKKVFSVEKMGKIETVSGAAGGVRFIPDKGVKDIQNVIYELCEYLSDSTRILPGGYLYMTDLIFNPALMDKVGEIFATKFSDLGAEYIITMETKGIPIALMAARALNLPLVSIRRSSRVTEGSVVSINYVTGSSRKIQQMSLSRRALPEGSKVIIIDDFMKAGGTAKGMLDLMGEFKAEVLDLGVLVETAQPTDKLVEDYTSLVVLENIDDFKEEIIVRPSGWVTNLK
ncbi:purine operon repressor PurR [Orenia metallireducens]|uniref:Purine operon repressor, PurR n=1 Tax=Orenia metallireducens TaxID=1413210 RepID=A0A285H054_9FIRM|nr:pur operon repressor [Orenia metallireducens]PRX26489.1 purine operon repressor PurR [Orenia metallireducens]SNY28943.1 purine operon repressor, PurR [Orenia metallireducens]